MSYGAYTDRAAAPSDADILAAVGRARTQWETLVRAAEQLRGRGRLKFYGRNYGWALAFARSGKSLLALYPGRDEFTAQVILTEAQVEEALQRELGDDVRETIMRTPPIHEGRWLFVRVDGETGVTDLETLLAIRAAQKERWP